MKNEIHFWQLKFADIYEFCIFFRVENIFPKQAYVACMSAINKNFKRFFKYETEDEQMINSLLNEDDQYRLELEMKIELLENQNKRQMQQIKELEKLLQWFEDMYVGIFYYDN